MSGGIRNKKQHARDTPGYAAGQGGECVVAPPARRIEWRGRTACVGSRQQQTADGHCQRRCAPDDQQATVDLLPHNQRHHDRHQRDADDDAGQVAIQKIDGLCGYLLRKGITCTGVV